MFQICIKDRPVGFDPGNKKQFSKRWVNDFMKRKGLSIRRKTNKKKLRSEGEIMVSCKVDAIRDFNLFIFFLTTPFLISPSHCSVFERMHLIHGYHCYTQHHMPFTEISDTESESDSTTSTEE